MSQVDHNNLQGCYLVASPSQNSRPDLTTSTQKEQADLTDNNIQRLLEQSQRERIAVHYEICRGQHEDVEMFPYDHFWEQPLLKQIKMTPLDAPAHDNLDFVALIKDNLYELNRFARDGQDIEEQLLDLGGYGPFCPFKSLNLVAICDTGVGIMPKSLLAMPNGDIILATFSARKGYCFKSFSTDPFQRIDKKKGYVGSREL